MNHYCDLSYLVRRDTISEFNRGCKLLPKNNSCRGCYYGSTIKEHHISHSGCLHVVDITCDECALSLNKISNYKRVYFNTINPF